MSKQDLNFIKAINILNSNRVKYWVCNGTALGLIRDKSLIPWDPDIDIGVWKNQTNISELEKIFKKEGFLKKKKFFYKDNLVSFKRRVVAMLISIFMNFVRIKNVYIKILCSQKYFYASNLCFVFAEIIKEIIELLLTDFFFKIFFVKLKELLIAKNIFYKMGGYTIPTKLFQSFKIIYVDGLRIKIPLFSKKYLKYLYGKNWKIPVKNYNWEKNENFASNK